MAQLLGRDIFSFLLFFFFDSRLCVRDMQHRRSGTRGQY